ncbi:AAA family ATPase [Nocardiopsis trehalosi]|jgi:predicted kinase|uniref:AAA family ATPase n=1 Tax=Nocardiopsis trehalosi TaxID=109329 RepID=UPI00082B747C|nr:AAA family ATPase [Nocardiopsis trehalosi]
MPTSLRPAPAAPTALRTPPADVLRYPGRSLVLLGGVPGAGKSTLLNRLYGLDGTATATVRTSDGVRVVDSQQSRNRLTPLLRRVPYPAWRWVVHVLHYLRVAAALRTGDPVVVHETGTRRAVRRLLGWYCRRSGVGVHLLLIDVAPGEARRSQYARGRRVTARSHRAHTRRWRRVLAACGGGPGAVLPGSRSLLLVDRRRADRIGAIRFTAAPAPPAVRR